MVPMLTCGLVRSNFAFATGVLLWTVFFVRPARPIRRFGTLSTARARAVLDEPHAPQRSNKRYAPAAFTVLPLLTSGWPPLRASYFARCSGTRRFRDDLLRDVLRTLGVGVELHAVAGPALG